jgi:hypothetical protein
VSTIKLERRKKADSEGVSVLNMKLIRTRRYTCICKGEIRMRNCSEMLPAV